MKELTEHQIKRQDFVDNAIFDFIKSFNSSDKELPWDIEMIGDIRDSIKELFVDRLNLIKE